MNSSHRVMCVHITGLVISMPFWDQPKDDQLFDDRHSWLHKDGFPWEENPAVDNTAVSVNSAKSAVTDMEFEMECVL